MTELFLIPCVIVAWALAAAVVFGVAALVVSQFCTVRDEWRTRRPKVLHHKALAFCVPEMGLHREDCKSMEFAAINCRPDPATKPPVRSGLPPAPTLPMDRITGA